MSTDRADDSISVVIPTYNDATYVGQAIESVLNQSRPVHECLIVNDGSTDNTAQVLTRYSAEPKVRIITQHNAGLGPSRNVGARQATGRFVHFLDSDDQLADTFIERLQQCITHATDAVFFSAEAFFDAAHTDTASTCKSAYYSRPVQITDAPGTHALVKLAAHPAMLAPPWLYISKTAFWKEELLAFPAIIHEDENVIVELFLQASFVSVITDRLLYRRIRPGSLTTMEKSLAHLAGRRSNLVHAIRQHRAEPRNSSIRPIIRKRIKHFAKRYLRLARALDQAIEIRLILTACFETHSFKIARKAIGQRLNRGTR